jgi:hypothetical protein
VGVFRKSPWKNNLNHETSESFDPVTQEQYWSSPENIHTPRGTQNRGIKGTDNFGDEDRTTAVSRKEATAVSRKEADGVLGSSVQKARQNSS